MDHSRHTAKVDVLFVNPPSPDGFIYIRDINRHGRSSWERMIWPQTSLASLAAVAETLGLTVDIVDCIAENIDWQKYKRLLARCRPRYCLSNVISVTYSNDLRALQAAKNSCRAVTIGMGPHLTNDPRQSLIDSEGLDFIILHEAEDTLGEILQVFEQDENPADARLREIRGIAYMPGRISKGTTYEPVVTEQRPFIEDLDRLPRPRHDLLPLDRYWAPFLGHYTFVEASRGCAFRCVFCRQAVMWQWKFRSRSGKKIAQEALYVHSLGVENILFHADTFTLDEKMVVDLCDTLIAADAPFRWACNTHVSKLYQKPNIIRKMKQAGCWMIAVGIESGDNDILKNIKKQITVEQAEAVVRDIDAAGIEPWGYFVLGLPGESVDTINKTIQFALKLPLQMAKFDIASPYPGTEFHAYALEKGYLKLEKHEDFDQNAIPVVEYPELSRVQIKAAVRRANIRFFLRPRIIMRVLRETRSLTMLKSLLLIIRDQFRLLYGTTRRQRQDATVPIAKQS